MNTLDDPVASGIAPLSLSHDANDPAVNNAALPLTKTSGDPVTNVPQAGPIDAELNKGEARNSLARAVAFHRLGRFRDRGLENQQTRAAALNLVTAAIILFNCRYLGRVVEDMRHRGAPVDQAMLASLSPLGWDRINLTGDYVWAENLQLDADGFMPLLTKPLP